MAKKKGHEKKREAARARRRLEREEKKKILAAQRQARDENNNKRSDVYEIITRSKAYAIVGVGHEGEMFAGGEGLEDFGQVCKMLRYGGRMLVVQDIAGQVMSDGESDPQRALAAGRGMMLSIEKEEISRFYGEAADIHLNLAKDDVEGVAAEAAGEGQGAAGNPQHGEGDALEEEVNE